MDERCIVVNVVELLSDDARGSRTVLLLHRCHSSCSQRAELVAKTVRGLSDSTNASRAVRRATMDAVPQMWLGM